MSKIKDILCLHHSHLDIGYTHPQPMLMELQRDYIDEAIELCLHTADFPEESRFRWTCEATLPVLKWMESASSKQIDQFRELLQVGQISISALPMHTTPLCNAGQMARLLYPVKQLREAFGIRLNTAINHDVNGQPWPMSQFFLDAGIEFYVTGINIHFGGIPFKRPTAFRWSAPDKRELLTFHGEHYSLFSQFFHTSMNDTMLMKEGIDDYCERLEKDGYPYDFIFLTATNPPLYDNNCPDPQLAALIRKFNEEGNEQTIRFVTPEMLLERVRQIPSDAIPVHGGDWTDYWNFGCASSARETAVNRKAKQLLLKADLLEAFQEHSSTHYVRATKEAWDQANLYDEHTWGASHSITDPDEPEAISQRIHKAHAAHQAADLAAYLFGEQMERLARNPQQSTEPEGIMLLNTSPIPQQVELTVPAEYKMEGRHLAAARIRQYLVNKHVALDETYYGTVELPPFSRKVIPFKELHPVSVTDAYMVTEESIETPFYRMEFDRHTGRIKRLFDKKNEWEMIDPSSKWTFFEFVQETIDPLHHPNERATFFPRDVDLGNKSISVWNHNWKARRNGADKVIDCRVEKNGSSVTYVLELAAPGVNRLEQRITLSTLYPRIELTAVLHKEDVRTPESVYFAFPLQLSKWRSHYDTAGAFVELDAEQLPGVARDWITVDQTVSVYDAEKGVTLACPDAPMVQVGDFRFGRESKRIERDDNPLLLLWPMNNYWDTNFWASQPGPIQFKYELSTFSAFDPKEAYKAGVAASRPVEVNAVVNCAQEENDQLLRYESDFIIPQYVKPAEDGQGWIMALRNIGPHIDDVVFSVPGKLIDSVFTTNTLEENQETVEIRGSNTDNEAVFTMKPGELRQLRVVVK